MLDGPASGVQGVVVVGSSWWTIVAHVDDAIGRDTVRLSREDLERIRILAWWARDAAARIGQ